MIPLHFNLVLKITLYCKFRKENNALQGKQGKQLDTIKMRLNFDI